MDTCSIGLAAMIVAAVSLLIATFAAVVAISAKVNKLGRSIDD